MILFTNKTKQDFLSPEWCKKLTDAGVDISLDAKYCWIQNVIDEDQYELDSYPTTKPELNYLVIPTYTLSELLYKLHEWIYPEDESLHMDAPLSFMKDAPFYGFYYTTYQRVNGKRVRIYGVEDPFRTSQDCYREYPIESAAALLLWCIENKQGYIKNVKDK